jgi:serine/threonine protein kinase HipA of HipAB toxin-antitoxin module
VTRRVLNIVAHRRTVAIMVASLTAAAFVGAPLTRWSQWPLRILLVPVFAWVAVTALFVIASLWRGGSAK